MKRSGPDWQWNLYVTLFFCSVGLVLAALVLLRFMP